MSDELEQGQQGQEGAPPDMTAPGFDWSRWFDAVGGGAEGGGAEGLDDDGDEGGGAQGNVDPLVAKAAADAARALQIAETAAKQQQMNAAREAWAQQASPAELALRSILDQATTPEELQRNAAIVKEAAAAYNKDREQIVAQERKRAEDEMQRQFGGPLPPNFPPVAEDDQKKVKELLEGGDMVGAAELLLKDF